MHSVVWWTCALFALAVAHVYERCELARALSDQGIGRDHLSTWVCIAYHESRFDTAAQNYNSGDHGLLQISQLYWCGPGKACGVSCASLRDEDISNDVKCALRIYEEHTRIQGDGFMAWVVYPLYCKQNTKKYLEGCEESLKNITSKPTEKSRIHTNDKSTSAPPFLSISSILRGQYENEVNSVTESINWLEYKFDNVDELTLPEYNGISKISASDRPLKSATNAIVTEKTQPDKLPAYFKIPSLLQEYFGDMEETNEGEEKQPNWVDVTFDNIDELKLPVSAVKKNTVVALSPTKSRTRIKIADSNNDKPKIPANSPNYLRVSAIVGQYYDNNFKSNRVNNNKQKGWSDFAVGDVDKLVVPNNLLNKFPSVTTPFATGNSIFGFTETAENDKKLTLSSNPPAFMKIASWAQQQQQAINKIESKWQDGSELNIFSSNKATSTLPFLSTTSKANKNTAFQENSTIPQKLPTYLNIIQQIYGNDYQQNNIFKSIVTQAPAAYTGPSRKIETHRRRHKVKPLHTSTTPESLTTEKPPPPVKPSRRIESNQFRHRSTTKTSSGVQFETNISLTTPQIFKPTETSTIPYKPQNNITALSNDTYQSLPTTTIEPKSIKEKSQNQSVNFENWRKTTSEVSIYRTTEKNNFAVTSSWNLATLTPIIYRTTTQRLPTIKSTQSIFDWFLKGQRASSTSSPKISLNLRPSSQSSNLTTTKSKAELTWEHLSTLRPWSTATSSTLGMKSSYESTTAKPKPLYSLATSPWSWKNSKQKETTTQKLNTLDPWATSSLLTHSSTISREDSTTLKTTTRNDQQLARNRTSSEHQTAKVTTVKTITESPSSFTSRSFSPLAIITTPKTIDDLFLPKNYSTSKPWSWSASKPTDVTQTSTKISYDVWSKRGSSTSTPWSMSRPPSLQTEITTEKSSFGQWPQRNIYSFKPLTPTNTTSVPQKLETTKLTSRYSIQNTSSQPRSWSNTPVVVQKPVTMSPSRRWSSTTIEPQKSNTTQAPSTFKPRFTWDPSNPWSWSWGTTPSPLQTNNSTTSNITKSWSSSSFSTYRPWSWMTSTTTPKYLITNSSSELPPRSWRTSSQTSNVSYSTPPSATTITKPSTPSKAQSLFDLYLSNFGRTPLKAKQVQESGISSTSEMSQVARGTDKQHNWQTT